MTSYDELERKVFTWAKGQNDVHALVVIGSRARNDHPANEWSDLDLLLFTTNPQRYATDASWLSKFGEIWMQAAKITGIGDPEWLVLYEGGFKVDFLLAGVTGSLDEMLLSSKYRFVTKRGMRILLDKLEASDSRADEFLDGPEWRQPDELVFTAVLNQFWLTAYRATTILMNDELWRAKMIIDCELRKLFLTLLEWQAKAKKGSDYDTWHDGRFLEEWVDPRNKAKLALIFASYDKAETSRALLQLIGLGFKLGEETAEIWHYHYPVTNTRRVRDWIAMLLTSI